MQEPAYERQLEAGQILWGEGELKEKEWNLSTRVTLVKDGTCKGQMTDNEWNIVQMNGKWSFLTEKHLLMVDLNSEKIENLVIFADTIGRTKPKQFSLPDSIAGDVLSGEKESNNYI